MTVTESTLGVAAVVAEILTVKSEDEESEIGAKELSEKVDHDEKAYTYLGGGGVQVVEAGVEYDPDQRGGKGGDVVMAEEKGFSSDDKIGVGDGNVNDGEGGGLGKVIQLKLIPTNRPSSSSYAVQHNYKRHAKRKKTRSIESFVDFDDGDDSRKKKKLSLILLGEGESEKVTVDVSDVEENEFVEKVDGVGGSDVFGESSATPNVQSDEKNDYNHAGGGNKVVEEELSLNRNWKTSCAMAHIPHQEDGVSVGGRPPRTSPSAPVNTTSEQLRQQQYAQHELQNHFQSSSKSISSPQGDQKAQGHSQQSTPLRQQHRQHQREMQQQQPPGWRVKLYRLNPDGSWDDCGTGRLQFYYARPHEQPPQQQLHNKNSTSASQNSTPSTNISPSVGSIFSKLGEPMICMRAEVSNLHQQNQHEVKNDGASETSSLTTDSTSIVNSTPCRQKVLLRTRVILLHDNSGSAYQRQGGNIITWCEPCNNIRTSGDIMSQEVNDDKAKSSPVGGGGVDLALSFQDNAGCKDIWDQITNVQARARELMSLSSSSSSTSSYDIDRHQEETTTAQTQVWTRSDGGFADDINQEELGEGEEDRRQVKDGSISSNLHHHQQQQHSPPKKQLPPTHSPLNTHHHHSFLHNSPNSPDHDAMEDRQLSSLVSSPLGLGGAIKPSSLFSSMGIPPRHPISETTSDAANLSFSVSVGNFQQEQHNEMHVHKHATAAANGNSLLSSNDRNLSSGSNEPVSNLSSSSSSSSSSEDKDMDVHLAAFTAATVSSSGEAAAAAVPLGYDDDDSDNDQYGPQQLNRLQHQNFPTPITIPIDNGRNNVVLNQNEQKSQQQHESSGNDDNNNNNINTNNNIQRRRRNLPSNDPTWNDLSSLREYINNFQYNQGGWGIGMGGGGYQQMLNSSVVQREDLLIYLASNDCANFRKLLSLFHDVCGFECTSSEDDSKNDDIEGSDGGDKDVQFTSMKASINVGDHSTSPKRPFGNDNKEDADEKHNKQNLQEKKDRDINYARLLASTIKSILLLNDPEIIEYVTSDAPTFELLCAVMEYDPDLREKASHVEFLRNHAKFCTVIRIDDDGGSNNDDKNVDKDNDKDDMHRSSGNYSSTSSTTSDEYNQFGGRNLIANIQRLFRVNFLRDTILRPTMDESNLSTLVSLGQFTMVDIIRGVRAVRGHQRKQRSNSKIEESDVGVKCGNVTGFSSDGYEDGDNYLFRIIRMLGAEIHAIRVMKWREEEEKELSTAQLSHLPSPPNPLHSASLLSLESPQSATLWNQHVAPQDSSLSSRMIRRSGCLMFLNELFNMARMSLQQHEKDVFIETTVCMVTLLLMGNDDCQKLRDGTENNLATVAAGEESKDDINVNGRSGSVGTNYVAKMPQPIVVGTTRSSPSSLPHAKLHVNFLSLLSAVLSDPTTDVKDRGAALNILGVITMHDPGLIRKYCLEYYIASAACQHNVVRPKPNGQGQVIFSCPTDDLMLSLIYVMATENDAGLTFQTSEIIRIILDTESTDCELQRTQVQGASSVSSAGGDGFLNEEYNNDDGGQSSSCGGGGGGGGGGVMSIESQQNSFLALFYDLYVYWLVEPFNNVILVPRLVQPTIIENETSMNRIRQKFGHRTNASSFSSGSKDDSLLSLLRPIEPCPVRASSTLEIVSFCVRSHVHRMKFFMLKTRSLGIFLKTLSQNEGPSVIYGPTLPSGIRCLKLATLKLFRSVLSVKDEFYHRHIIQHDLFTPLFDLFRERSSSVGNNLLSSAILEICDFICVENIKSLIDCIVVTHLNRKDNNPSLEDIANPYVETFKQLRKTYNNERYKSEQQGGKQPLLCDDLNMTGSSNGLHLNGGEKLILNKKALEDQRKFRQADRDDSYFNDDDDAIEGMNGTALSTATVEDGGS